MAGKPRFDIAIPIYPGVDLLDVAAPWEIFNWMKSAWQERAVSTRLVAMTRSAVTTRDGLKLTPDTTFNEVRRRKVQFQLLWVPGGSVPELRRMMASPRYLEFLRDQSAEAEWVTSVCEGAMILAASGLLDGYKATTHWAFLPCFEAFPEVKVAAGYPRFVVDRNRVTGGGISSGLDEALKLVELIAGREIAEQVQVTTQYFPKPPVKGEIPGADTCPLTES
ncbi:MAG: DJ-1/PfpI family protein [Acidobacteriota bacterium]